MASAALRHDNQTVKVEEIRFVIDKDNRLYLHVIDCISVVWDLSYGSARKVWTRAQNTDARLERAKRVFREFGGKVCFPYSKAYLAFRHIQTCRTRDRRDQSPELLQLWNDTMRSVRSRLDPFPSTVKRNQCLQHLPRIPLDLGLASPPGGPSSGGPSSLGGPSSSLVGGGPRMMDLYISSSEDSASDVDVMDDRKRADEEIRPLLRSQPRDSALDSPPRPTEMRTSEAEVYDSLANQVIRSQGLAFNLEQCAAATSKAFVNHPPTRRKGPP